MAIQSFFVLFNVFLEFLYDNDDNDIALLFWNYFTPAFAGGFLLECEWRQVSSSLKDSSLYSSRSQ